MYACGTYLCPRDISSRSTHLQSCHSPKEVRRRCILLRIRTSECHEIDCTDRPAFSVSTIPASCPRTDVSMLVYILGTRSRYPLSVFRCLSVGFQGQPRFQFVADWAEFSWSYGGNHHWRSHQSPVVQELPAPRSKGQKESKRRPIQTRPRTSTTTRDSRCSSHANWTFRKCSSHTGTYQH